MACLLRRGLLLQLFRGSTSVRGAHAPVGPAPSCCALVARRRVRCCASTTGTPDTQVRFTIEMSRQYSMCQGSAGVCGTTPMPPTPALIRYAP